MEPNAFIAEVYRRMALRYQGERRHPGWDESQNDPSVVRAAAEYARLLPPDKNAAILDLGLGAGWFLGGCLKLGYRNLAGADFEIQHKSHIQRWAPDRIQLHEIKTNIGDFLSDRTEQYDFIHMSHVIEHIPKYSLLWIMDALYRALKPGGSLLLRTPNMEGPCANSSYYVTLSHEYGFAGSNLTSLLHICGFDNIRLVDLGQPVGTVRERLGKLLRWPYLKLSAARNRLFGVNFGGRFGPELVIVGTRGNWPPFFNERYR